MPSHSDGNITISSPDLRKTPVAEWIKEAEKLFGPDKKRWKFKCPSCEHIQTPGDFIEMNKKQGLDLSPEIAWFSCIGRWLDIPDEKVGTIFDKDKGKQPCNYTLGGLIRLAKTIVIDPEGNEHRVFEFAEVK